MLIVGIDWDHAKMVADLLSSFHASTYDFIQTDPGKAEGLKAQHPEFFTEGWLNDDTEKGRNVMKKFLDSLFDTAIGVIENHVKNHPEYSPVLERLKEYNKRRVLAVRECLTPKGHFDVLIHNDCWTNNVLFR